MSAYPAVLSEDDTLARVAAGASIARFGDGELRLATGGQAASQRADERLAAELCGLLAKSGPALVTIPNIRSGMPYWWFWERYAGQRYVRLYGSQTYGSTFITRPDNAPAIDRPDYWAAVDALWRGRDIVFVRGDASSLTAEQLASAASVRLVAGPRRDAYAEADRIEEEIGLSGGPVILCLGAAATVLAARLAAKGVQGLDLGHIGMFMRCAGAFAFAATELASSSYREQLRVKHASKSWGNSGHHHCEIVKTFAAEIGAHSILDYGCGGGRLAKAMMPARVREYDPGIAGKDDAPKPAGLVVATDVLEHIEPDRLEAVLAHIYRLAGKGAFLIISLRPARELLPDGRNAHLIVERATWWLARLRAAGWAHIVYEHRKGLFVWLRK